MQSKLQPLTSLRFFAALLIVIQHSTGVLLPPNTLSGWPLDHGVSFFFVLSGFILTLSYPKLETWRATADFWRARIARIWPMHLFALALLFVISTIPGTTGGGAPALIANILLVHAWVPSRDYYFSYNALSWTVSTEFFFYLLFPLLIANFKATWWWKLLASLASLGALVAICAAFALPGYSVTDPGITSHGLLYANPLARLFEFVFGMCTCLVWQWARPRLGDNRQVWTALEIIAVVGALWLVRPVHGLLITVPVVKEWWIHTSSFLLAALVIFVMASGTGALGRLLSLRPLVFLGEISYSMYLLHQILVTFYARHVEAFSFLAGPLRFPIFLGIVIAAASTTYLVVETPLRKAIRRQPIIKGEPMPQRT
jgi:peptidoglycan/LPS O-acetylase OafA/YrhL